MAAQPLVQRGVRWKIACGDKVSVWRDLWLNYDGTFHIHTFHIPEVETLTVLELMILSSAMWNRELFEAIFDEDDIVKVLRTPIALHGCTNKLI